VLRGQNILDLFDKRAARFLAWGSALFSVIVTVGIVWNSFSYKGPSYFEAKSFTALKEQSYLEPNNAALKEAIRKEDARRRAEFLASRAKVKFGAGMLFAGLAVFALSMRRMAVLGWKAPMPIPFPTGRDEPSERKKKILSITAVCAPVIIGVLAGFILVMERPKAAEVVNTTEELVIKTVEETPVPDELKWPGFRGPTGQGIVLDRGFPKIWDASAAKNIVWKSEIPVPGKSSPIVWGNRVFLTGYDQRSRQVLCYSADDGSLVWSRAVRTQAALATDLEPYEATGFAAPTPVTDGKYVFAFFGTNELAAFDFSGRQVWSRWFGKPESAYGIAASPVFHNGILILQLDQGGEREGKSFLYGIHPENGNIVWKNPRNVANSWSSPLLFQTADQWELVTCANPWVISYNPSTGEEYWRAKVLSGDVAPLPVYFDGLVYTMTAYSQLSAIRTGGLGDVTSTQVVWKYTDNLPDVCSQLTDGNYLLVVATYGPLTCLEAKTGKLVWEVFPGGEFWSSPTLVGKNVYLTDQEGKTLIFELGQTYSVSSTGSVGEPVFATPAFAGSRIYVRGEKNLYSIGEK
jgi:outer membrane protein assembly factor BamB